MLGKHICYLYTNEAVDFDDDTTIQTPYKLNPDTFGHRNRNRKTGLFEGVAITGWAPAVLLALFGYRPYFNPTPPWSNHQSFSHSILIHFTEIQGSMDVSPPPQLHFHPSRLPSSGGGRRVGKSVATWSRVHLIVLFSIWLV